MRNILSMVRCLHLHLPPGAEVALGPTASRCADGETVRSQCSKIVTRKGKVTADLHIYPMLNTKAKGSPHLDLPSPSLAT